MRIIAGKCRGRRLATAKGQNTRPTGDRVKEAIFSTLGQRLPQA
ncbi:MAG: RsmD family RNA methyltransferase, partial [Clostridiales bacterium]